LTLNVTVVGIAVQLREVSRRLVAVVECHVPAIRIIYVIVFLIVAVELLDVQAATSLVGA
jgi:hypothetical protein